MKRRYVLKNKRRFATLITLFLMISIFAGLIITVEATSNESFESYKKITVQKGDTLWEIALRLDSESDPRVMIYKIKKLNNLENSYIYEGQELLIPQ